MEMEVKVQGSRVLQKMGRNVLRVLFARVYVNVDVAKDLPVHFDILSQIGNWRQPIEYENKPPDCNICKKRVISNISARRRSPFSL